MTTKLKLIAIGDSTGVILPRELLEKLHLKVGDDLHVLETPDGTRLSAHDEEMTRQLGVAERVMERRHDLLRKLAE